MVQIECTDALKIIRTYDSPSAFHYCDPPYYNADMGHYDGYTLEDYKALLKQLSKVEGKFLLSSYPSEVLKKYVKKIEMNLTAGKVKDGKRPKKIKVLTANYPISNS